MVCIFRRAWLLLALAFPVTAASAPIVHPADSFDRPFEAYRRSEMSVPPEFRAECAASESRLRCTLTDVPKNLFQLIARLEGGAVAEVRLLGTSADGLTVEFVGRSPEIVVRQARLEGPPRWVVEAGLPTAVGPTLEDEQPLRPWPLPVVRPDPALPPPDLEPLGGDAPEARAFDACFAAWQAGRLVEATKTCESVLARWPDTDAGRAAARVFGEVWAQRADREGERAPLERVLAALQAAEDAAKAPRQAVRYALLAGRTLVRRGLVERAELLLDGRAARYDGTPAAPFLAAARAVVKIEVGERDEARRLLSRVRDRPGDSPDQGQALLGLAGLAYADGAYLEALGLFDAVRVRWPELLRGVPGPMFAAAEVYALRGRRDDARALYEEVVRSGADPALAALARVRLAYLQSFTDPAAARARLAELTETLLDRDARHLVFVYRARLHPRRAERARILRLLRRKALSDHVLGAVLLDMGREALAAGNLREAYDQLRQLWTILPDDPAIRYAPQLFERVLFLLARAYLEHDRPRRLMSLYFSERDRFENHRRPDVMHLIAGRALRRLGLYEEAVNVLQRGLRRGVDEADPDTAARVYLEMAGVLREAGDRFRLREILEYLDRTHADRLDEFEYWMAKGTSALWEGRHEEARDIFRYALNGPVTPAQRVVLARAIADVYEAMEAWPRAVRALRIMIELHERAGGTPDDPVRREGLWRIAALEYRARRWPRAVAALAAFMDAFPDDRRRTEARYLKGRSLVRAGDVRGGAREWDLLVHEAPDGPWGRLAKMELEALRWRLGEGAVIVRRALSASER